ncbi:MAG: hypothetical protein ACM3JG_00330 [Thiohalocapsa sp.]
MNRYRPCGRWALAAVLAAPLLLALPAPPARALMPSGPYLQSCTHIRAFAGRVVADCRRVDGVWSRTALDNIDGCVGGIANNNGHLTCNRPRRDYGAHRWDGYGSSAPRGAYRPYAGR